MVPDPELGKKPHTSVFITNATDIHGSNKISVMDNNITKINPRKDCKNQLLTRNITKCNKILSSSVRICMVDVKCKTNATK